MKYYFLVEHVDDTPPIVHVAKFHDSDSDMPLRLLICIGDDNLSVPWNGQYRKENTNIEKVTLLTNEEYDNFLFLENI